MNGGGQRIDKWLFFARIAKSRSLAAKIVQSGRVRVNRDKIDQASHLVKPGDVLTITLDRRVVVLKLVSGGTRRGPAEEARLLYEDLTPPPAAADAPERLASALAPIREAGKGRPTKRERRQLGRLRRPDEND